MRQGSLLLFSMWIFIVSPSHAGTCGEHLKTVSSVLGTMALGGALLWSLDQVGEVIDEYKNQEMLNDHIEINVQQNDAKKKANEFLLPELKAAPCELQSQFTVKIIGEDHALELSGKGHSRENYTNEMKQANLQHPSSYIFGGEMPPVFNQNIDKDLNHYTRWEYDYPNPIRYEDYAYPSLQVMVLARSFLRSQVYKKENKYFRDIVRTSLITACADPVVFHALHSIQLPITEQIFPNQIIQRLKDLCNESPIYPPQWEMAKKISWEMTNEYTLDDLSAAIRALGVATAQYLKKSQPEKVDILDRYIHWHQQKHFDVDEKEKLSDEISDIRDLKMARNVARSICLHQGQKNVLWLKVGNAHVRGIHAELLKLFPRKSNLQIEIVRP